ncbi:MAG: response regulator, partial [Verrucomicrobiae bacterium]|nr:response regulator [Verrucomicrobiae bacterium]
QEAVSLYKEYATTEDPIEAVLLDMTLPGGLSGDEVMTLIRRMDQNARVIATSGFFSDDAESTFRQDGYVGILPKPYAVERLSQKLAEAMHH